MKKKFDPQVRGAQELDADGVGPAVSCVVSQASGDPGGWLVEIRACLGATPGQAGRSYTVARVVVPARPPGSNADRLLFVGSVPGAQSWSAVVTSPTPPPPDTITVDLFAAETNASIVLTNGAVLAP